MPKERLEYSPEDKQEASQESKDEFLYNIDVLTARSSTVLAQGSRLDGYEMEDGRSLSVFYTPESKLDESISDDPVRAQLNITEYIDEKTRKTILYYLRKSGAIDRHAQVEDPKKEFEEDSQRDEALDRGEVSVGDSLVEMTKKAKHIIRIQEEEKEMGLAFVSEAELKKINSMLKEVIEKK